MSPDSKANKGIEILDGVAARALDDEEYRERLIDDPVKVLRDAGMTVPDDLEVVVHQNSSDRLHLVLPTKVGPDLDVDQVDLRDVINCIHF